MPSSSCCYITAMLHPNGFFSRPAWMCLARHHQPARDIFLVDIRAPLCLAVTNSLCRSTKHTTRSSPRNIPFTSTQRKGQRDSRTRPSSSQIRLLPFRNCVDEEQPVKQLRTRHRLRIAVLLVPECPIPTITSLSQGISNFNPAITPYFSCEQ